MTRLPAAAKNTSIAPSQADPLLQAYMREVHKYPLLTREEEARLAQVYKKDGDRDAFQKLVTSNLRFVVKIAYQYINYRLKLLDLIQEGNMGLVKAVEEFDPYRGVRLTTYAVWWIRSYMQDAILRNYSLVKMGTTQAQKKLFYRLKKEQARLEREGIAPPQRLKLLASRLDVREKDVVEMQQRLGGRDVSLDAPTASDDDKRHIQFLADDAQAVDDTLADSEQRTHFKRILEEFSSTLEGRDKSFFDQRLISEKPKTLQELGDEFGVSKERARQIEEKIKERLKAFVVERYPDYNLL
ncbi:MAG: RNA polymerase factor sigma-32 [Bdellovibrionota bacterium]